LSYSASHRRRIRTFNTQRAGGNSSDPATADRKLLLLHCGALLKPAPGLPYWC